MSQAITGESQSPHEHWLKLRGYQQFKVQQPALSGVEDLIEKYEEETGEHADRSKMFDIGQEVIK